VATGGGLSCNAHGVVEDTPRWVACRPGFFLPVRVLSRVFRGKYLALLRQAFEKGQLAGWPDPVSFHHWLSPLHAKEWVVYAKPPAGGPDRVLKYLARYTHRVAISNQRLLSLEDGQVTFRYKDYSDDQRRKNMTLSAEEFLRRFVQHVLPKGFVKVRHYGLLANRHRAERLVVCRRLLLTVTIATLLGSATTETTANAVEPAPRPCCSRCGSLRLITIQVARVEDLLTASDTS